MKWSENSRSSDIILAVWPYFDPITDKWVMQELYDKKRPSLVWRDRWIEGQNDSIRGDRYSDKQSAINVAKELNPVLNQELINKDLDPIIQKSLLLKIEKALQCKKRLAEEEELMLSEAIRRHASIEKQDANKLKLASEAEIYRQQLADQLAIMPYLKVVKVKKLGMYSYTILLFKESDGSWSGPIPASEKEIIIAERSKIANGFNMNVRMHWGTLKAEIRNTLLPRANQLLQLASVQRLLAEALARGEHVLVSNGIIFWYENEGGIGWKVKEAVTASKTENVTIWKEGTIRSTNHGRLVILPYIKSNGDKVQGYTKNAPKDGLSLPRHPDDYVTIPFKMYNGDLMIGLFGELPYE